MCGIAGIVRPRAGPEEVAAALDRMWSGIETRGPDGRGQFVQAGAGILNARLAVIDLVTGDQPIWNEAGTVACVYNGEIYNYRQLGEDLLSKGHTFRTTTDTEVLVHLYEERGADLVRELHGMYAFALYDTARRRLVLGRDRLGIKPLYLARVGEGTAFASSVASLLALGVSRDPDEGALAEYLRFYKVAEPRTAYRAISTLLPGHVVEIDVERGHGEPRAVLAPRPEGNAHAPVSSRPASVEGGGADRARAALEAAVRSHLVADVEVGAFLSGGIDSSLVVAEAQRLSGQTLRTFSVAFPGHGAHDESPHAEAVARALGTKHETIEVEAEPAELLRRALAATQQPFAIASFLPMLALNERARRDVKVVLTGDGGDEVGAGYPWYRWMARARRRSRGDAGVATSTLALVEARASRLPALRPVRRAAKFARGALAGGPCASDIWRYDLEVQGALDLLAPEHRAPAAERLRPSPTSLAWGADLPPAEALRQADVAVLLRDEMLPKLDRAGMAHGVEGRVPLLDDAFVDAMLAVPISEHLGHPRGKALLRRWAGEAVPGVDLGRRKHGFDVPVGAWLQGPLRADAERLLLGDRRSRLTDLAAAHGAWRRMVAGVPGAAHTTYALLLGELWYETFVLASSS